MPLKRYPESPPPKELIDVLATMHRLQLSRPQVYRMIQEKILHAVRLPGCSKIFIQAAEVDEMIASAIETANAG
jgi:excisionase family DNA binding protein